MKKDVYDFVVNNLYYTNVEREILKHYNLGRQNSSSLPATLHESDSGEYYITGTKGGLKFFLEINKREDGTYHLFCYPE